MLNLVHWFRINAFLVVKACYIKMWLIGIRLVKNLGLFSPVPIGHGPIPD